MADVQFNNESGFTLIEFIVAVVILMVGMLGLLQTANVAISSNRQNQLRNEATLVMDKWLSTELAKGYASASISPSSWYESRPVLNGFVNYSVVRSGTQLQNSKEVRLTVSWPYRNMRYSYKGGGIISNSVVSQ